jgi:hypothetical protein
MGDRVTVVGWEKTYDGIVQNVGATPAIEDMLSPTPGVAVVVSELFNVIVALGPKPVVHILAHQTTQSSNGRRRTSGEVGRH